jgi:hypothetical protein
LSLSREATPLTRPEFRCTEIVKYLSASKLWPDKRGVASLERDNLLVFYYLSTSKLWPDKRGVASLERDNLLVFYSLSTRGYPSYQARVQMY